MAVKIQGKLLDNKSLTISKTLKWLHSSSICTQVLQEKILRAKSLSMSGSKLSEKYQCKFQTKMLSSKLSRTTGKELVRMETHLLKRTASCKWSNCWDRDCWQFQTITRKNTFSETFSELLILISQEIYLWLNWPVCLLICKFSWMRTSYKLWWENWTPTDPALWNLKNFVSSWLLIHTSDK